MQALCFDIKSPFASFRNPTTTRGFLSFPFPPRTTLMGLIGAILGLPRNEIYLNDHPLNDMEIALKVLNTPLTMNFRTNQLQTAEVLTLYKKFKIFLPKLYIRGKLSAEPSPQNLVLLKDVHYRVFIKIKNHQQELIEELETKIKERKYSYPPYLGRANYLASIDFIDKVNLKELIVEDELIDISTLCSAKDVKNVESGKFSIITNVPMSYMTEKIKGELKLEPGSLISIIYFTENIKVIPAKEIYEITSTECEDLKNLNIIFLSYQ
ncbi:MAG: type I-B CRISPR-associated protein Cas5b [Promethearchaeota archaeon]